jgi:hypothetical protein
MRVQKDLYSALFVFVKRACVSKCTCLFVECYLSKVFVWQTKACVEVCMSVCVWRKKL